MKYKVKIYAKALVALLSAKSVDEKEIITNFLKLLEKDRALKKAREIITLAETLFLQKHGNKKIIVETARKVDVKELLHHFVKKGDIVEERLRPELIAGIKIIVNGEKQIDNSLLRKLDTLYVSRNY